MFTADAHCDTLYNIAIKKMEPGDCAVTQERLAAGNVGLEVFALFSGKRDECEPYPAVKAMISAAGSLGVPVIIELPDAPPESTVGILSIEGGEALSGKMERLFEFHEAGVKMIALTWNYENEIGVPAMTDATTGLKPFGRDLIGEMDKLGVLSDVSHLNEAGFWDVAELTKLPVVASHSNLRSLCDTTRNLWPEQTRAIIKSNGFIGVNFYTRFLTGKSSATLTDVLQHIDGIAELGGIHCVGFGSDFDGIETWPEGMRNPADFPALIDLLLKRGYTDEQVAGIAGMNLWRVLKEAENH